MKVFLAALAALTVLLAGCGGGGSSSLPTPPSPPIQVAPTVTYAPGGNASVIAEPDPLPNPYLLGFATSQPNGIAFTANLPDGTTEQATETAFAAAITKALPISPVYVYHIIAGQTDVDYSLLFTSESDSTGKYTEVEREVHITSGPGVVFQQGYRIYPTGTITPVFLGNVAESGTSVYFTPGNSASLAAKLLASESAMTQDGDPDDTVTANAFALLIADALTQK
jgi:hypothetical protein